MKLALIADIHYGNDEPTKRGSAALGLLENALSEIGLSAPDLLIDLGDRLNDEDPATDERRLHELADRFAGVEAPRAHLVGNHDLVHLNLDTSERVLGIRLQHHGMDLSGWRLVFWNADVTYEPGVGALRLPREDLIWLRDELARFRDRPVAIFSHVPLGDGSMAGNYYFERRPYGRAGYENADLARAVIEHSGNVVLAVAGHVHWNSLHTVDGVHYATIQSLTETFTTHPHPAAAWAELTVGDRIELAVHGRDPARFTLPIERTSEHWLASGGPRRPVSRREIAEQVLEEHGLLD